MESGARRLHYVAGTWPAEPGATSNLGGDPFLVAKPQCSDDPRAQNNGTCLLTVRAHFVRFPKKFLGQSLLRVISPQISAVAGTKL